MNIEQSVHTIYHFAMDQIEQTDNLWQDEVLVQEHISKMRALMETMAKYTDGAMSVYYRLAPELLGPKQGVWLMKNENSEFTDYEMTDIAQYDKNDVEHVGWYYQPIANKKETWMNPYYNQNAGAEMLSFVIPVFVEGKIIGVIGMDITTEILYQNTKSVKVYETGYAFLMDNKGNFVYHPEMKSNIISDTLDEACDYLYGKSLFSTENHTVEKYQWKNEEKRLSTQSLVMMNVDAAKVKQEVLKLEEEIENFKKQNSADELRLQMAVGTAVYTTETDGGYKLLAWSDIFDCYLSAFCCPL